MVPYLFADCCLSDKSIAARYSLLLKKDKAARVPYNPDIFKEVITNKKPSCFIANIPSLEDLEAWNSSLPRPVLNLGFPKAGSTSMYWFFKC